MTDLCWQPSEKAISNCEMTRFMAFINQQHQKRFTEYKQLYQWSIEYSEQFWSSLAAFNEIIWHKKPKNIVSNQDRMPGAKWFDDGQLNFAENLLRYRDEHIAIEFRNEIGQCSRLSYAELYQKVTHLTHHLKNLGVSAGDRVAGLVANTPETIIAMLATTSLGAVWSSCSPDFGLKGIIDRFEQIQPMVLFAVDGHYYGNKQFNDIEKLEEISQQLPTLRQLIVIPYLQPSPKINTIPNAIHWQDSLNNHADRLSFTPIGFNDPVYILYSSGTTGKPKCMVHGVGGILLQHMKELRLHTDITREDNFFFYTTCGWMMWNWLVSGLSLGCTLVLYDGSPFHPHQSVLIDLIDECDISVFGVGAKYIEAINHRHFSPKNTHQLSSLKSILGTGSPLLPESFDYIYQHFPKSVRLSSISGGSDIVSCFALGNPILPVYRGHLQCRGLGLSVDVYDEQGRSVANKKGELVCTKPFPCMPLYFWNDDNNERYHQAYFTQFPNVWAHGDYAELTSEGGMIIYGRSDATLNPSGVRVGTAEIYSQVDQFDDILNCIAVGQSWQDSERIVLFVVMRTGVTLSDELKANIISKIKQNLSPHHTPKKIIAIADIPRTISGKTVELAVKKIIHGQPVDNTDALANPECLEAFKNIEELKR